MAVTLSRAQKCLCVLSFLLLALMNFTTITAHDLGWHFKTGEWIFEHLQIPRTDIYGLNPNVLWIDLHWLFQILTFFTGHFFGLLGINLLRIIFLFLIFIFLLKTIDFSKNDSLLTWPLFILTALACQERFQLRPELMSFLFLGIDLFVLERAREKNEKALWILPFLQILWTNTEGLFMMGPALISVYLLENILEKKPALNHALIFILTVGACFINPYGLQGFLFPFTLLKEISFKQEAPSLMIGELKSPFSIENPTLSIYCFYILLGLGIILLFFKIKRVPKAHVLLFILFSGLATLSQRNIALFSLIAFVVILKNIKTADSGQRPADKYKSLILMKIFYLTGSLYLSWLIFSNQFFVRDQRIERFGLGIAPEIFPQKAIQYLAEYHSHEKIFNTLEWGPALIYEAWPQLTPFIDTRLEVAGEKRLNEYHQMIKNEGAWQDFSCILLDHIQKDSLRLISKLAQNPDWQLSYFDDMAVLFEKKREPEQKGVQRKEIVSENSIYSSLKKWLPFLPPEHLPPLSEIYRARLYLALGENARVEEIYSKVIISTPEWTEAWINLAYLEEEKGDIKKAITLLEGGSEYNPKSYQAYFNLGTLYLETNSLEKSLQAFQKAIRIKPTPEAQHNLAIVQERLFSNTQSD
ncbi:MAG: hypothetical protein HYS08_08190 [Chlamydiae bacterium]|nr:hypothetical protein [Chlamydiota bacterium]MBI3266028.1 hypothetical protein [Chlamydiota bacterium]